MKTVNAPSSNTSHRSRLAVALDTGDWEAFCDWAKKLAPEVGILKVGLEAYVRWGHDGLALVREAAAQGGAEIFLDLKLHDIPNTVAGAVRAARELGVRYLTVHAGGGERMLRAAVEAAEGEIDILAVTVLTHLDESELAQLQLPGSARERAQQWAELAAHSGCAGVVCSPLEAAALRARLGEPFLLVTPGIRPEGTAADDQRRVATPALAIADGASILVVGRPITASSEPVLAARGILGEIAAAQS